MIRSTAFLAAAAVAGLLSATGARAEAPAVVAVCANCHGTDGKLSGPIPRLAGQSKVLLASKLRDFRDGKNDAWTVMPRLAKGLDDSEIDRLADFFSNVR
jgi:sulfide dehydrogenase cytochrome subunit